MGVGLGTYRDGIVILVIGYMGLGVRLCEMIYLILFVGGGSACGLGIFLHFV